MSEDKAQYQAGERQQLKPCPFCGGHMHMLRYRERLSCMNCGAEGPDGKAQDLQSLLTAWNTRAADAEVERLRAQLAQAKAALEVLAVEAYYNDHRDDWRNPDCGLRLEHEATGKDAPAPWQFAADALKGLE